MSTAVLIHDDECGRAYVYVEGSLVLDERANEHAARARIAEALGDADEAVECEGTVAGCGGPPETLDGWSGLQPVGRTGDDSLRAIIATFAISVVAMWAFNAEYLFGEDIFWPDGC